MQVEQVEALAFLSATNTVRFGTAVLSVIATPVTAVSSPLRDAVLSDLPLRVQFDALVREWKQEIRYTSSLTRIVLHPAYQAIIGMGKSALPLILAELQRNGGHWFWALHAITQEDPVREGDGFEAAAHAWLTWGRARGYL